LFEPDEFEQHQKSIEAALAAINNVLKREGIEVYRDIYDHVHLRNTGTGASSSMIAQHPRPLSDEEIEQRKRVAAFLDSASEDDFTDRLLVPLFQRLGFHRVQARGHKEKAFEYGKDLWMKFQLPTGHWLYFGAQIKRDKLDAKGGSGDKNVATVLDQVRMAFDHEIFDPDTQRQVLVDHIFVIASGDITRSAENWLIRQLDTSRRRQIIFMGRNEFLDHAARIIVDLKIEAPEEEDVPF
jgi:hypothetical protein